MPRPTIAIDVKTAQKILDGLKPDQFQNELSLCTFVANQYNVTAGMNSINHQLIKLRINSGVLKLPFDMPKGKRGRQPGIQLTDDHKKKLLEGRKQKKIIPAANGMGKWQDNMKRMMVKKPNQLNGVLRGNKKSCVKTFCEFCVGGYDRTPDDPALGNAIRDCRGYSCPLYIIRPYQKNNAEENSNGG